MAKKDSNNKSSGESKPANVSGSLSLFLFISLIFFGLVLLIYWNFIVGLVIFVISSAYYLINKYLSTVPIDDSIKKIFHNKKYLIVSCFILILSALSVIILNEFDTFLKSPPSKDSNFSGIIWDEQNEPLNNVIVYLPELNLYDTTDIWGRFSFNISDSNFTSITFIAQKEGYKTYEAEGSVGNPNYNFNMIKK